MWQATWFEKNIGGLAPSWLVLASSRSVDPLESQPAPYPCIALQSSHDRRVLQKEKNHWTVESEVPGSSAADYLQ